VSFGIENSKTMGAPGFELETWETQHVGVSSCAAPAHPLAAPRSSTSTELRRSNTRAICGIGRSWPPARAREGRGFLRNHFRTTSSKNAFTASDAHWPVAMCNFMWLSRQKEGVIVLATL